MKIAFWFLLLVTINLSALEKFQSSQVCQKCHPIIYKEHFSSQHRKASIFNDAIHKAVWDKHPLKKKDKYVCAKCHTPNDARIITALKNKEAAVPKQNKAQDEGVSCVSCHNIKSIQKHEKSNNNLVTTDKKILYSARESEKNEKDKKYKTETSMFGFVTKESGSPFHEIDFSNKIFYNGNVCLGCHSHKQNAHGLQVCKMDQNATSNSEKENCITCHMPLVQGSFSTIKKSKMHRYHGFTGTIHKPEMLKKYLDIGFEQEEKGFSVKLKNHASHAFLLQPLRLGQLHVVIYRTGKKISLEPKNFVRIIGKDKKPAPPWVATEVLKNTQLQANELRSVHFDADLQSKDELLITFGYFVVNPKAVKKLNLASHKEFTQFKIFKQKRFYVK